MPCAAGSADATSAAITEHANRVRSALAAFLAERQGRGTGLANQRSRVVDYANA